MGLVKNLWRKLTHTKALDQSSGRLETVFFESIYRIVYAAGISNTDHDKWYVMYSNIAKLMITFMACGEVWYGFTETSTLDEVAALITVTFIQFLAIYKYRNMMVHKDFYKKMASSMESPYFDISTEERQKLVDFWCQTNERYLKLLLILGHGTLTVWFISPLVDEMEYNYVVGIYLPFYYMTPVRYPLAYMFVSISFYYMSIFVMVTDLKMQTHLIHLVCQFSVLVDCFKNLLRDCRVGFEDVAEYNLVYNKSFVDKYTKRLGHLVQQHKQILRGGLIVKLVMSFLFLHLLKYYCHHTMNMRDTLSSPMLGQLAVSGTLICFIAYQVTTAIDENIVKCLMSLLFLGYNLFIFYIICRWCEEITNQSAKVGEAIYCSGWECGIGKLPVVRSTIMFVITRAKKPLVLTAGGMYDLSLSSYASLVKTSYSALTVLLRIQRD